MDLGCRPVDAFARCRWCSVRHSREIALVSFSFLPMARSLCFRSVGLIGLVGWRRLHKMARIFVEASLDVASRRCGFIKGGEGSLVVLSSPISLLYLVSLPVTAWLVIIHPIWLILSESTFLVTRSSSILVPAPVFALCYPVVGQGCVVCGLVCRGRIMDCHD